MMKKLNHHFHFFGIFLCMATTTSPRNVLRTYSETPVISTRWATKQSPIYHLKDSHLEIYPLFKTFDKQFFEANFLPKESIPFFYDPKHSIKTKLLKEVLNNFFQEVRMAKRHYTDFVILKDQDFNRRKQAGLLIVKGKRYPYDQFVVKLFMETPRSFIRPYNKGVIAICHHIIGHGATRHMLGFTRLKNREVVIKLINDHPFWSKHVTIPRKWFWLPEDYPWIHLSGYNISGEDGISIDFPGAYAIVADAIDIEREFSIRSKRDRYIGVTLCNYLQCLIDLHLNNFIIEKNTGKIALMDTEHFPTMIGLKKPFHVTSYAQWYKVLVQKGVHEYFWRSKKERRELQRNPVPPYQGEPNNFSVIKKK